MKSSFWAECCKNSESTEGSLTRYCVQQVHFHKAFDGVDGWHRETDFTGRYMLCCDVVDAVLSKGVDTFALADSSKFGLVHFYALSLGYQIGQGIIKSIQIIFYSVSSKA